ncbi:MFS transporter [Marinomonas arenicola]|uniref:MFS transporter n=1 Tax=Marinomonas arenicola TaxID=569601 RepID=UPI00311F15F2
MTAVVQSPVVDSAPQTSKPTPPPGPAFGVRLAIGLLGVLLAAMMSGLNSRLPSLGEADFLGAMGFSSDQGSWITTWYQAGELMAMPFACWLSITFSLRRFQIIAQIGVITIAVFLPFIQNAELFMGLRFVQGYFAGSLVPILMMSALRFLPLSIRLHGLALYAMTATLAPNVAVWLAALFLDKIHDWRWLYWHVIPLGLLSISFVYYGIPKLPQMRSRIKEANYLGAFCAVFGIIALTITLTQGIRMDWLNSSFIRGTAMIATGLLVLFLWSELHHPAPFMRLQLLSKRNLGLGFTLFFALLIVLASGVSMPLQLLAQTQGFRMEQLASIGLWIGLPQIFLGSVVAFLLYQSWVDARVLFSIGLACIGSACLLASNVTSEWMTAQFVTAQVLQAIGQPMAVVCLLFLATSVVQPMEGPFVSGIINTLRALGTMVGGVLIGQIMVVRNQFHFEDLLAHWNTASIYETQVHTNAYWAGELAKQAGVLSGEDIFIGLGVAAFVMIPLVMCLMYIPAPKVVKPA